MALASTGNAATIALAVGVSSSSASSVTEPKSKRMRAIGTLRVNPSANSLAGSGSAYHGLGVHGFGAFMQALQSGLGVAALVAFAWAISENRRAVSLRRVAVGLAVAFVLAVLFLKVPPITRAFGSANHVIDAIYAP